MVKNEEYLCEIDWLDSDVFENRIKKIRDNILIWKETEQTFEKKIPGLYQKFNELISGLDKVDIVFDIKQISEIRLSPIQRKLCRRFFDKNHSKLGHAYIVTEDQTFLRVTSKLLMRNYFDLITYHRSTEEVIDIIDLART